MDASLKAVIHEAMTASSEGQISFGEVVRRLIEVGVERYHVDFTRRDATYYLPSGEFEIVPVHSIDIQPAQSFSVEMVAAAVRGAQAGAIKFPAFCEHVLEAGCVGHIVSMAGQRVIYYGRTGDIHVELFPGAK